MRGSQSEPHVVVSFDPAACADALTDMGHQRFAPGCLVLVAPPHDLPHLAWEPALVIRRDERGKYEILVPRTLRRHHVWPNWLRFIKGPSLWDLVARDEDVGP